MKLLWIKYKNDYKLFLEIARKGDLICGLSTKYLSAGDKNKIRSNYKILNNIDPGQKILWIKNNLPSAYSKAYRSFKTSNIVIINEYAIKEL